MYRGGIESAKRRSRRIAALAGVALAVLVSAVPAQAKPGHGRGHHHHHHGHKVVRGHKVG